ncbi:MAG TPA: hypothetical protein VMZ28_15465, partial [Kofleriaceae bacterium]|nr:hypothetical protein [Kofleriaceae bacterium]
DWTLVPSPDITVENLDDVRTLQMGWERALLSGKNIPLGLEMVAGMVDGDQLTLAPQKIVQPDHVQLNVNVASEQQTLGQQFWHIWMAGEGDDDDLVLDADDYRMPWVGAPVYDDATRVFAWPQVGEGEWDATYLNFNWFAADGKKNPMFGNVRIVVPPGQHQFVLPPVPEEYQEWLAPNLDEIEATVMLFDSDQLDWDEARQLGVDPSEIPSYGGTITEPALIRYSSSLNTLD